MKVAIIFVLFFFIKSLNAQNHSTFTDMEDGRTYQIVKIGNQWWFAENLNYDVAGGSYCYNNDTINCSKYGRLYTWEVAKRVCPRGWHLPTKEEYDIMFEALDDKTGSSYSHLITGGDSGFEALLSGKRTKNYFEDLNQTAYFWTNSQDMFGNTWYLNMLSANENAFFYFTNKKKAFAVRCVRN